ncbi:MAG: transglutaminase [Deltaproteobacteria bacterium]|nr:MAG: transglutaminase [Deltaproteobacteria bacterium]
MKKLFAIILFGLICSSGAIASSSAGGTVVMNFDLSESAKGKEVDLWIPYPVSGENQLIENIRITGNYENAEVTTDRVYSTPMLHVFWPEGAGKRELTFSFYASRSEQRAPDLKETNAKWDPRDYAKWLASTNLGPTDGIVKNLAEEITADKESLLEKARAIYDWTCENTYRAPETRGCGEGDVCNLLSNPGGKCADIHSIFVSLARAAGIPSREIFGIRLGKEDGQEITTWQHCWAEFYLPGRGWVAVDPGDVRKMMLKRGLTPKDAVPEDLREAYWGGVEPYRVKLATGRDIDLTPKQDGAPLNYLMYPYAEVDGAPLDWLSPDTFKYKITYRNNGKK